MNIMWEYSPNYSTKLMAHGRCRPTDIPPLFLLCACIWARERVRGHKDGHTRGRRGRKWPSLLRLDFHPWSSEPQRSGAEVCLLDCEEVGKDYSTCSRSDSPRLRLNGTDTPVKDWAPAAKAPLAIFCIWSSFWGRERAVSCEYSQRGSTTSY